MRTLWILLFAMACPAVSQELVLVTQVVCAPCKVAKALLEKHKSSEAFAGYTVSEWNLLRDRAKIDALKIGKLVTTPTLLKLDKQGQIVHSTIDMREASILAFAADKPAEIDAPMMMEPFVETFQAPPAQGVRVITYDIATQFRTGQYNSTAAFGDIEYAMDALGRYLNLDYVRVSRGGQWHIIQANTVGGKDWAMWTNGANTYVSPVYRFFNATQARMCYVHERGHVGGDRSHGGSGLMNANGGYLLTEYDMRRFKGTPWKSDLRPWHEPDWFKSYLKTGVVGSPFGSTEDEFRLLGH